MKIRPGKKRLETKGKRSEMAAMDSDLRERIALKAYELYEQRGWSHGLDTEDWLEAERLVLIETKVASKSKTVSKPKTPRRQGTVAIKPASNLDRTRST